MEKRMQGIDAKTLLLVFLVASMSWCTGYLMQPAPESARPTKIDFPNETRLVSILERIEARLQHPAPAGISSSMPESASYASEPDRRTSLGPDRTDELLEQVGKLVQAIEARSLSVDGAQSGTHLRRTFESRTTPDWHELDRLLDVYRQHEDSQPVDDLVRFCSKQEILVRFGRPTEIGEERWAYERVFVDAEGTQILHKSVEFNFHEGHVSDVDLYYDDEV